MVSDFGGFPPGQPDVAYRIADLASLQDAVRECAAAGRPMRARGFGHSMNGMAVPRRGEALLDLTGLRHVRWTGTGRITAGAGLAAWELDRHVRQFGWKLPVVNDGGAAASSIGGYISAGGIGEGSMLHGGFWENVASVGLVAADGEARQVGQGDPLFRWLFGSLGAFGLIHEAAIALVPASSARTQRVPDTTCLPSGEPVRWPPHLWLTLFVSGRERDRALSCLRRLAATHPGAWTPRRPYEYFLRHRRFNPPLLFAGRGSFLALGVWGDRAQGDDSLAAYLTLEAEFQADVEAAGWRRYFQTELIRVPRGLERYVGAKCARAYGELKAAADPRGLLNPFMAPA
jgi:hypothetical protein